MKKPNKADIRKVERRIQQWEGWLEDIGSEEERAAAKSLIRTGKRLVKLAREIPATPRAGRS